MNVGMGFQIFIWVCELCEGGGGGEGGAGRAVYSLQRTCNESGYITSVHSRVLLLTASIHRCH